MNSMTAREAFLHLKTRLTSVYDSNEAANIADWVIEDITGKGRLERLTSGNELTGEMRQRLQKAEAELLQHRPVQYVLGKCYFAGMELKVNEQVLIPRPETEELVEWLVQTVQQQQKPNIIDIGTGSGCIALSAKKYLPSARVTAIDISEKALAVAKENAVRYGLDIDFLKMDILNTSALQELPLFDIIVSNPPYISPDEKDSIQPNVLDYEPHSALFVTDNDPLQFYKAIARFGETHLAENGCIFCELHRDHARATRELFRTAGWHTELRRDMQQNNRMLYCRR